jgi:hypothetical protein
MSLRIIWGGPWNERSCIAGFGVQIVAELAARGHQVEVVRTELEPDASLPARPSPVRTRWWRDVSIHELRREVDAVIVNFGDSYSAHGAMLENIADVGAVGIFHDHVLARLVANWANETSPDPYARLRRMVDVTYGRGAWRKGQPFLASVDTVIRTRPMLEWFAAGVCGAVISDGQGAKAARGACSGPVEVMTTAAQFSELEAHAPSAADQLVIAMVGADQDTSHIDPVVHAIGDSDRLRQAYQLKLIGHVERPARLQMLRLATKLDMQRPSFCDWASTDELPALFAGVDVVVCLGACSQADLSPWTVLALCSARPTLIFADGSRSEIPGDCVLACAPGNEVADAQKHLRWIMDNRSAAHATGERARAFALRTYTPARYVDALLPLVETAVANRPITLTGQALGRVLASFGIEPDDPAVQRIGGVLSGMLGSSNQ